jgi:hypothetical protein
MRLTLLVLMSGAYPGTQCDVRRLQISSQLLAQVVVLPSADDDGLDDGGRLDATRRGRLG